jgi:hypothetical protein
VRDGADVAAAKALADRLTRTGQQAPTADVDELLHP